MDEDVFTGMLNKNIESVKEIYKSMNKYCKHIIDDCLTKQSNIPNILIEGILVVIDAIKDCNDNKVIFMR